MNLSDECTEEMILLRHKMFFSNEKILLESELYNKAWPFIANVWVTAGGVNFGERSQTYTQNYTCRFNNAKKTKIQKDDKNEYDPLLPVNFTKKVELQQRISKRGVTGLCPAKLRYEFYKHGNIYIFSNHN